MISLTINISLSMAYSIQLCRCKQCQQGMTCVQSPTVSLTECRSGPQASLQPTALCRNTEIPILKSSYN